MTVDKIYDEWKQISREMIIMFKTVWDEIEQQFSGLSIEERFRVFSVVAPFISDMFNMALAEDSMEDMVKPDSKRKKKRGV
jgi:hypothetical protein